MSRIPPFQPTPAEGINIPYIPLPQQTVSAPRLASELPSRQFISTSSIPLYEDNLGNPTYTNNQSWIESFSDRRTYAQTAGGAGYWFNPIAREVQRTPARYFYEEGSWFNEGIGNFSFAEPDPVWFKQREEGGAKWISDRVNYYKSLLGDKVTLLEEDYGPSFLEDVAYKGVSLENEAARVQYAMDVSLTKRRIEDYDAASNWGTYLGTKTASAIGNYMATDPNTTALTIASLGAGTVIPAVARSSMVASRLPWLSTPANIARSWIVTNGTGLSKIGTAIAPVDGALSGYAMFEGYNRDQSILRGDNAILDDNPLDDIALGAGIGLVGGFIGYSLNVRQLNRDAAIEALATAGLSVPTKESADYAVRFSASQSNLLRRLKANGIKETEDIFKEVSDPRRLHDLGVRHVREVDEIIDWVDVNKPTADELKAFMGQRHVAQHNNLVRFRDTVEGVLSSKPDGYVKNAAGDSVPNFEKYGDEINAALRKMSDDKASATGVATTENLEKIYAFMNTRVGMGEYEFHRWFNAANLGKEEIDILVKYIDDSLEGERNVIQRGVSSELQLDELSGGLPADKLGHADVQSAASNARRIIEEEDKTLQDGLDNLAARGESNPNVERIQELLTLLSRDSSDVRRSGLRSQAGSPQRNIRRIYDADDSKVVNRINRELRKGEARGEFPPDFVASVRRNMQARLIENNLLRRRLRDGELGEMLGIMQGNGIAKLDDPRLIDGLYPFRTAFNDEFDSVDDIATRNARRANEHNESKMLVATPIVDVETEFAKVTKALEASAERQVNAVKTRNLSKIIAPGKGQPNFGKRGLKLIGSWGSGSRKITVEVVDKQTKTTLRTTISDDLFDSVFTKESITRADASGNWRDLVLRGNLDDVVTDADTKLTTAKRQFSLVSKSRELGTVLREEDWDFARANGLIRAMRGIPLIGNNIIRVGEWMINKGGVVIDKGNDTLVGTRSKLWFNPFSKTGRGTMDTIMMMANLVDSPHVLRRSLGNLSDDQLHSIQQIRNFNLTAANRVIRIIKDAADAGRPITAKQHEEMRNFLRAVLRNDKNGANYIASTFSAEQKALVEELKNFVTPFVRELRDVIGKQASDVVPDDSKLTDHILLNMLSTPVYERVVAQTGAVRRLIGEELTELADKAFGRLKGSTVRIKTAGARGPAPTQFRLGKGIVTSRFNLKGTKAIDKAKLDGAIEKAATRKDIAKILHPNIDANTATTYGIKHLVDQLTDTQVAGLKTWEDLVGVLDTIRQSDVRARFIADQVDANYNKLNPVRNRFTTNSRTAPPLTASQTVGWDLMEDSVYNHIMSSQRMSPFVQNNIADIVGDFAGGVGTRIRLQGQLARNFIGGADRETGIFTILREQRDIMRKIARDQEIAEGKVAGSLSNKLDQDLNNLEDMLAHALGYSVETGNRYGFLNTGFRILNGSVRATYGSFFGLQTAIAEVPKAILLNANRNGFVNAFIDFVASIGHMDELDSLGTGIEQYTRKYALGVDNEAYMGGVHLEPTMRLGSRAGVPMLDVPGALNPRPAMGRAADIATGRVIDQNGLTRLAAERGTGAVGTGAARVVDAGVSLLESVANANTRLGGQQYFTGMARNIAARGAKKELVRNIELIKNFSREWNKSLRKLPADATFETKLALIKQVAKNNNIEWGMALRLVKHGLTDEADLKILSRAFKTKDVVPTTSTFLSGGAETRVYSTQGLRDYLDNFERKTLGGQGENTDRILMKMTSYLEEEVNSSVVNATGISSIPSANIAQRYLGQFSNYVRGFVHQAYARGAHQSNMGRMMAMALPVLIGEIAYFEAKRLLDIKGYKGQDSYQDAVNEMQKEWREQPEVAIWRTLSRIPVGGNFLGFMFNHVINPMEMELLPSFPRGGKETGFRPLGSISPVQDVSHKLIYSGVETALNTAVLRGQTQEQASTFVQERTTRSNMWSPPLYQFKPFADTIEFVNDLTSSNPYDDNYEKWFAAPRGVWGLIPGVRTWQMNAALKGMGYEAYQRDSRAWRWDQHNERMRKLGY